MQVENQRGEEESFAQLFEESLKHDVSKEGEIVTGTVIQVTKDYVVVDIGYKSEGQVPVAEFESAGGEIAVKPGDKIDVLLESRENENGLVVLSKEKADRLKVWDDISQACERDELIEGTIAARVKGGLSVAIRGGVKAFLPGSQVDLRPVRNLDAFIGKAYKFKVIKFNKKRGNIVLSRRVLLEKERAELKGQTLERLKEGQIVEGIVKNLTEYGAFIDLGGIDGLLHITDMSWGRVNHPSELFQVGDHVRVKVLKFNPDTERVSLGLKQITDDPWSKAAEKYVPGTVVRGKVVSLKDYGAFVELEEGIEGLVHISEMSWTRRVKHPSKMVAVGDTVEAVVLDVDAANNRISLGMKQLEPNPYEQLRDKYPPGTVVKGRVRNIADFGIFVEIEEGIDGLVHISDMSWTQRIKHPSEMFQKGDEVEAVVLNIDTQDGEKPKISLGIKQLIPDPWDRIPYDYPVGKIVDGKVLKVLDFGAFVELEKGIEGLVHVSEISDERVEDPRTVLKPAQEVKVQIITVDPIERKIGLSIKGATRASEMADAQGYAAGQTGGATLGDVMRAKLAGAASEEDKKAKKKTKGGAKKPRSSEDDWDE
jgi:small subunit ribosomal protein S1